MLKSMTGFAAGETKITPFGRISVEMRSTNHKFLEVVLQLPESIRFIEDKLKEEIQGKIKRGRVICVININGCASQKVFINKELLKGYIATIQDMKEQLGIEDQISINTLINLPGIFCLGESHLPRPRILSGLQKALRQTLDKFIKARLKEGQALYGYLNKRAQDLKGQVAFIQTRFDKVAKERSFKIASEEERASFLKDVDISEEIERLTFHIQNFIRTLAKNGPVGKELDFITQEMQREANTIGAKSCDKLISGKVVQLKSQVEQMREQLQNIE